MKKELLFIQKCGHYSNEILVLAGVQDKKTVFRFLKKKKVKKESSKWVLENFDEWNEEMKEKQKGLVCFNTEIKCLVLVLRKPDDSWDYWTSLLHEVHHLVYEISHQKYFVDEGENQAYLFEFLFTEIRRKLMGIDPCE
jgi:hypothetical protein